ncbi:MAG: hypothetical protein IPM29_24400 [Planctomycetes bacterium]|nr:hypothetical protein [Planctomycetota bacterium]
MSALDRRVLGAVTLLMMVEPQQIRDREWLAERFVQVAIFAHGFDPDSPPDADVRTIQDFARARMDPILTTALGLFVRIAEDLQQRSTPYGMDDAKGILASYVGDLDAPPA